MERGDRPWVRTLAAGLTALALGAALALLFLPEWHPGDPDLSKDQFRARYREAAERAGFRLSPGEPRLRLRVRETDLRETYRLLGEEAAPWVSRQRDALCVEVSHRVTGPQGAATLSVDFSLDGRPRSATRWDASLTAMSAQPTASAGEQFARLLLAPGESLRPWKAPSGKRPWLPVSLFAVTGSGPPEHVAVLSNRVWRRPGPPSAQRLASLKALAEIGRGLLLWGLMLGAAVLWLTLALANRLGLANALALGLLLLLLLVPSLALPPLGGLYVLLIGGTLVYMALLFTLLWSTGESLLRSRQIDFVTSLDTLRTARLGPRGGRELLDGLGYGAGLAGLWLGLLAAAVALPGLSPLGAKLNLPLYSAPESYWPTQGMLEAAGTLVAIGVASHLPERWSRLAAVFLATVFSPVCTLFYFAPEPAGLILGLAPAAVLVHAFHRSGLTAMLTASVVSALFPVALLAALHATWAPAALAASAGLLAVVALLGAWGLSRPAEVDAGGGRPPAFVRRLRAKRALQYEMDLLARMQRGLLPRQVPAVRGYEIAAHAIHSSGADGNLYDVLRDEAGRLWVVTAEVAGQGYSRAVAQAMIKAVLVSSMDGSREGGDRLPSEILEETRRVLYREGPACESAALTIGRIDPQTGRAVLSCAGAPPPLLLAGGEVSSFSPCGPPLTPGSAAGYQEIELLLPPGGTLLFCSEGLFGAADWSGVPFGRDHAGAALRSTAVDSAAAILQSLLDGWRLHTTLEEPPAGTTVVAIRRVTREELANGANDADNAAA